MASDDKLDIVDLEGLARWFVPYLDPSDPLMAYIAISLTKTLRGNPHLSLASATKEVLGQFGILSYNPADVTPPGSQHSPADVYALNYRAVARSDIILFIRIAPSVGMGEEAQIAANQLVPWCQIKCNDAGGARLSPVLLGLGNLPCGECHTIVINSPTDTSNLRSRLMDLVKSRSFVHSALRIRAARRRAKGAIEGGRLGTALRRQRLLAQLPLHEVGERLGVSPQWFDAVESDSHVQCGITLSQLVYLANALHGRVDICPDGLGIRIEPDERYFSRELATHASEFADIVPHGPVDPPRLVQRDMDTQALWRLSINQKMGTQPDVPRATQPPAVEELNVELSPPISNLQAEQEERVTQACDAVTEVLERFSSIRLRVSNPRDAKHLISEKAGRHDFRREIYRDSVKRILQADLVISVLSPPATGVGVMSQVHTDATIPRIAIVENEAVSRMYTGLFVPLIGDVITYGSSQEIQSRLRKILADNWQMLARSAAQRRDVIRRIARAGVARAIQKHRVLRKKTLDAFVKEACQGVEIEPGWLKDVAEVPELSATLTLIQMVHIAQTLGWQISINPDGIPCWDVPMHGDRDFEPAISNLVVACEDSGWSVPDDKLLAEWQKCENVLSADEHRDASAYTVDFWKNCLFPEQLFPGAA